MCHRLLRACEEMLCCKQCDNNFHRQWTQQNSFSKTPATQTYAMHCAEFTEVHCSLPVCDSGLKNVLTKCCKLTEHVKHGPGNATKLRTSKEWITAGASNPGLHQMDLHTEYDRPHRKDTKIHIILISKRALQPSWLTILKNQEAWDTPGALQATTWKKNTVETFSSLLLGGL